MARVRFGDVVKEVKINIDRKTDDHEFFIAGEHMESENIHITKRGRFADSDVGPAFIRLFKPGQILYGSRRTYLKKVAVADFEGITSNTTFVLETKDPNIMLQELLPFIMLTDNFTAYAVKNSKGSTNPYILFSDLAAYEFELPDIEEQKRLTAKLLACDRAKEAYKKQIQATDDLVKSQFIELFEGKGFSKKKGSSLFKFSSGKFLPEEKRLTEGIPVYGGNGIAWYTDESLVADDTIVIGRVGAYCGNVRLTRGNKWITDNAIYISAFKTQEFNLEFLEKLMVLYDFHQYASAAGQPKITQKPLEEQEYIIPPIDLQIEFAKFVEQSDKSKLLIEYTVRKIRRFQYVYGS